MKEIIEKLKKASAEENTNFEQIVELLKELREYFKANLNEPGIVKIIRMAYENIEENDTYTFLFLEDGDAKENISYLVDLLADHTNKYNKEELQDIRNLMEGIEEVDEEIEEEE
jgi:hypothetical protein